jgi:hypothetical protein
MTERTTVRLPEDLIRRAKRRAAAEGRTLTALIEDGLRQVVNQKSSGRAAERTPPPVSSASGGLQPGVDLEDSAELQGLEDLQNAGRFG